MVIHDEKFLPEDVFLDKSLSAALLFLHLGCLAFFAIKVLRESDEQFGARIFLLRYSQASELHPKYITYILFVSNFIGIVFARTLHYQFYSWYFHTIPFLLLNCTLSPTFLSIMIYLANEFAFNVYPATGLSSGILQAANIITLLYLYFSPSPLIVEKILKGKTI